MIQICEVLNAMNLQKWELFSDLTGSLRSFCSRISFMKTSNLRECISLKFLRSSFLRLRSHGAGTV